MNAQADVALINNIVAGHVVGITVGEDSSATVSYTLWDGNGADLEGSGTITHTHSVSGRAAFVDPAADDYHIRAASAALDHGNPAGVPPAPPMDLDGEPRPFGAAVDIGADEWRGVRLLLPYVLNQLP
jgi:hypothetical protein